MRKLTKPSSSPPGPLPTTKVAAAGAAGSLTVLLVWVAGLLGLDVPAEAASAFTVLVGTTAAYLKPGRASRGLG